MSDIERIPSMRKAARQGVPKRKPREMAKPTESGKTKDAPKIAPRVAALPPTVPDEPKLPEEPMPPEEPVLPVEPTLALELELAAEPVFEGLPSPVPIYQPEREPEPEPELVLQPEPDRQPEPSAPASAQSVPRPAPAARPSAAPAAPPEPPHFTLRQLTARVDGAFAEFRAAAYRYPAEHMDDHLAEDSWTRKQMLAHIAAWHDLTSERLIKMMLTGRPVPLDRDPEAINAAAARVAIGKTAGEVLKDMEATFARLRRQMLRLTDAQLHADDEWAAQKIAANTYEHYAEHIADLAPPDPFAVNGARR